MTRYTKVRDYKMWKVILFLCLKVSDAKEGWALVGAPLLHAHPCKGNEDITLTYEPGLPPGQENQYHVVVTEEFPVYSVVKIKFDSEAALTLSDSTKARISVYDDGYFHVRFYEKGTNLNFKVKGPINGTIPYLINLEINTVEYCKRPNKGILDQYVQGYQDTAELELSAPDDSCGRRKVQHVELITNGQQTKPGDWPWHAAIYRLEHSTIKYICGGTLLAKNFVMTAAHCASIRGVPVLPEILSVVLGKYNLIGGDISPQEREVHQIIVHEQFVYERLDNDIALLKLRTEATYSDYVQPACLWNAGLVKKLPHGQIWGSVVGWGFDQTDTLSSQLKQANMPKVSETLCIKSNPVFFGRLLTSKKFCAGLNNGTSACNGDSGGGFFVSVPNSGIGTSDNGTASAQWYVRGIVSLSVARQDAAVCDTSQYVIFTDIAKYRGWLKKNVKFD